MIFWQIYCALLFTAVTASLIIWAGKNTGTIKWQFSVVTSDNYCIVGYFSGSQALYNQFPHDVFDKAFDYYMINKTHLGLSQLLGSCNWFYPGWVEFRKSEIIKLPK